MRTLSREIVNRQGKKYYVPLRVVKMVGAGQSVRSGGRGLFSRETTQEVGTLSPENRATPAQPTPKLISRPGRAGMTVAEIGCHGHRPDKKVLVSQGAEQVVENLRRRVVRLAVVNGLGGKFADAHELIVLH